MNQHDVHYVHSTEKGEGTVEKNSSHYDHSVHLFEIVHLISEGDIPTLAEYALSTAKLR